MKNKTDTYPENLDNYIIIKNIPRNNDMDFNIRLNFLPLHVKIRKILGYKICT